MNKYKVEFTETKKIVVDVLAKNEDEAKTKAENRFIEIGEEGVDHYYQVGNTEVEISTVYDVTNTDDPFNA